MLSIVVFFFFVSSNLCVAEYMWFSASANETAIAAF